MLLCFFFKLKDHARFCFRECRRGLMSYLPLLSLFLRDSPSCSVTTVGPSSSRPFLADAKRAKVGRQEKEANQQTQPHSIHVWYIYLHLPYILAKCR